MGLVFIILYIALDKDYKYFFYVPGFCMIYFPFFISQYLLKSYEIDTENDTITDLQNKKYPLHISNLTTVTYKESRKGKYRSLFIHDSGVGFMDIRVPKEKADMMTAQLLEANPSIEVKHVNYL